MKIEKRKPFAFEVGDKVVCTAASSISKAERARFTGAVKKDIVYVVRGLDLSPTGDYCGLFDRLCGGELCPGLYLVGIFGDPCPDGSEQSLDPAWFTPFSVVREYHRQRLRTQRGLQLEFQEEPPAA